MKYWWLSFCDASKPTGQQFLGGCWVQAEDFGEAVAEAWRQKCNPGGEAGGTSLKPGYAVSPKYLNRLMTRAECEAMDEDAESIIEAPRRQPKPGEKVMVDIKWKRMEDLWGGGWMHMYLSPCDHEIAEEEVLLLVLPEKIAKRGGKQLADELAKVIAKLGLKAEAAPSTTVQ